MLSHKAQPSQLDLSTDIPFLRMIFLHNAQRTGQSQDEEEGMEWVATCVAWQRKQAEDVAKQQEAAEGGCAHEKRNPKL